MSIENLAETLLEKLRWISQAETVVGKPIQSGDTTIVPVSRVSVGFGVTGNSDTERRGSGGGARVDPIAFLVIRGDDVKVMPVNKETSILSKVSDLIPEVLATIKGKKD